MKTVGELIQKARQEHSISLEEIAKKTKIHVKYLRAIEANDFDKLPASAFTKGFLKKFAKEVKVNPDTILAIFRRDYDQDQHGRIIPRSLSEPIKKSKNWFTPTTLTLTLSAVIGVVVVGFFVRQVILFQSAPTLDISTPEESAQVTSPVLVSGTTDSQASVRINNRPVTVDELGQFSADITLTSGEHTLVVTATNRMERSVSKQRVVFVTE